MMVSCCLCLVNIKLTVFFMPALHLCSLLPFLCSPLDKRDMLNMYFFMHFSLVVVAFFSTFLSFSLSVSFKRAQLCAFASRFNVKSYLITVYVGPIITSVARSISCAPYFILFCACAWHFFSLARFFFFFWFSHISDFVSHEKLYGIYRVNFIGVCVCMSLCIRMLMLLLCMEMYLCWQICLHQFHC